MIFFLNLDDDACMNARMHGWNSWDLYLFFFSFSIYFIFRARKTRLKG